MVTRQHTSFNRKIFEDILTNGNLDAAALFYLLKITHSNSIIYSTDIKQLFFRLKSVGLIARNFKQSRFLELFNYLLKYGYISYTKENHFRLAGLHQERSCYKSSIGYKKDRITFKIVKALLVKEELKSSVSRQQKAVEIRKGLATHSKKAYALLKKSIKKARANGTTCKLEGESYTDYFSFTYRNVAKKLGLTLSNLHNLIAFLERYKGIKTKTIKVVARTPLKCNVKFIPDFIADLTKNKSYFYVNRHNQVISVLGTAILSF